MTKVHYFPCPIHPDAEYYERKGRPTGRCKTCQDIYHKEWRTKNKKHLKEKNKKARERNPERYKAYQKRYQEQKKAERIATGYVPRVKLTPEQRRENLRAAARRWYYKTDKKVHAARMRNYLERHPEYRKKVAEYQKEWRLKKKEKLAEYQKEWRRKRKEKELSL